MSTLANSEVMERRTDESLEWRDQDVIVIKNRSDVRVPVKFSHFQARGAKSNVAVIQPARQATRTLKEGDHDGFTIVLGGREAVTLRSGAWTPPHGRVQSGFAQ